MLPPCSRRLADAFKNVTVKAHSTPSEGCFRLTRLVGCPCRCCLYYNTYGERVLSSHLIITHPHFFFLPSLLPSFNFLHKSK